ncbi:16S rRNA (cytosine(967)-C(5))-methyltransferase RsmB [Anaerotruncus sp. 80]|uniref:16S rRNA (cytosine(967)-C(5))-methyltransferase n=1 Tax=Anaerotruncus colihominis TaxID=169435 RepID=A0A845QN40_9FIRM|nr:MULTISPECIES: 16S rRNA (cytosine(967)-C(5))-methyltransferase RsmB [Anaerotruncus]NBH62117.1 16S rRNA (cytosine(967)-C(5))-methyltransferase RsmB [Anaerotruncus colihominis]NCF02772.1 16S rRNA (cytosine(967)-C(5))-methyltransferase RsmB [Anaerotruncus sp. 80]
MDCNRKTAYSVLFEIEKNQAYSNLELNRQIGLQNPDNPAFVRELVYGVLENRIYLDYLLAHLIPKGLSGIKKQVLTLLRMGLYQLIFMESVPPYAAIGETVKLAKKLAPGRDGFINGVLRGYQKKGADIKLPDSKKDLISYLSVRYSYAPWIVELLLSQYGMQKAEQILKAGNDRPKLSIRVNMTRTDRKSLAEQLTEKGFVIEEAALSERVLFVSGSGLLETKAYEQGLFSVQDEASVLAAEAVNPLPGQTVLDICAAPGGKSLAMAEMMGNKGVVKAFDIYGHKLTLISQQAQRLGLSNIITEESDGCVLREDLRDSSDCVLVDGPCSGLGVIRRKPEIKYKELADEGRELSEKQLRILLTASCYVKEGGILVYSTCTVNRIENTEVVERFLKERSGFTLLFERQYLPDTDETDGFYICKMRKQKC